MIVSEIQLAQKQILLETISCPQCGSENYHSFITGSDVLHGLAGTWQVVRCKDCDFIYTNPRPAPESVGDIYPESYAPHLAKTKHKKRDRRDKVRNWVLTQHWNYPLGKKSVLGRILSYPALIRLKCKRRNFNLFPYHGSGKLLDYGCGGGSFLLQMRQLGWQVAGMDMSDHAVDECRGQELAVFQGDDPTKRFESGAFDVVTMWHVLEHVPDPNRTLNQIHQVLTPAGRIVIAVPNIGSWLFKWLGKNWYPLDLPRHFNHFDKSTIGNILEKNGFKVTRILGQRHGQVTQRSMKYLLREKNSFLIRLISRSRSICSLIEALSNITGNYSRMIVHAEKK